MITKATIKQVNSLKLKKNRQESGKFLAEGLKIISELLDSNYEIETLFCTPDFLNVFSKEIKNHTEVIEVKEKDLARISLLKTPQKAIAIVKIPPQNLEFKNLENQLTLFLDDINNPGNLGTIIRLANWFGIPQVVCSEETVDVYNPKVIQATMGALAGTEVFYVNKIHFFENIKNNTSLKIYGSFIDGDNIYKKELTKNGIIILGNESHGISNELIPLIDYKLSIPNFSNHLKGTESLNVAVASAIFCSEFRRTS